MSTQRQVYLLNPKELSPETIAVTFAKTSRSPQSFREIAAELTDDSSAQFNERWVVGYGHSSVAEHAVLHIAIENVSRLAVETIESNRLASYTEKSTRYQKWDAEAFYLPPELTGHRLQADYRSVCQRLFSTYERAILAVQAVVKQENLRRENESEAAWDRRIRTQYIDVCRYLLPACSLANVGVTINARLLEHAIQKMLSSPLREVREIGVEVKRVAQAEAPTLVKYADRQPYLEQTRLALTGAQQALPPQNPSAGWCQLVAWDPEGENRVLAAALFRFGNHDYAHNLAYVNGLDPAARLELVRSLLGSLEPHEQPLRELEHTSYTFDVVMDQGAYFEVKRHRMMTQTVQNLTADLGYAVPRRIAASGFEAEYRAAMDAAAQLYHQLAGEDPDLAAYGVPNGFNRRLLLTMNLREAYHFCSLRSGPTAHFAVRRVAQRMAEEIFACHPALAAFMQLPQNETWQSITAEYFACV
jgi:thymidylate synthase ThyX